MKVLPVPTTSDPKLAIKHCGLTVHGGLEIHRQISLVMIELVDAITAPRGASDRPQMLGGMRANIVGQLLCRCVPCPSRDLIVRAIISPEIQETVHMRCVHLANVSPGCHM